MYDLLVMAIGYVGICVKFFARLLLHCIAKAYSGCLELIAEVVPRLKLRAENLPECLQEFPEMIAKLPKAQRERFNAHLYKLALYVDKINKSPASSLDSKEKLKRTIVINKFKYSLIGELVKQKDHEVFIVLDDAYMRSVKMRGESFLDKYTTALFKIATKQSNYNS